MTLQQQATATIVESIPHGLDLEPVGGASAESTADALTRLVEQASESIDVMAMYWSLRPTTDEQDFAGWTIEELEALGATEGERLFDAMQAKAAAGVRFRIVESQGFGGDGADSVDLAAHPSVERRTIDLTKWYGSGIMHQKLWLFDGRSMYVGSANQDWRSLTQVKELGIVVENQPDVAAEAGRLFEAWWRFAGRSPTAETTLRPDGSPCPSWSTLVPEDQRQASPLADDGLASRYGWDDPASVTLNGEEGHFFLSAAPDDVCLGRRTTDIEALTSTLAEARSTACINVMDFAPLRIYGVTVADGYPTPPSPQWWPDLFDAVLDAVARGVAVRMLVSEWAHTNRMIAPLLSALETAAGDVLRAAPTSQGSLAVRRMVLPGWDSTGPREANEYPGHTRVNHTKYIVTERRLNIGTSNMTGDYFAGTAGASVNLTHPTLVAQVQHAFDRDWAAAAPTGESPT